MLIHGQLAKLEAVQPGGHTPDNDFAGHVRDMRAQGMTVSSVSLGAGAAKDVMQMIAQEGGGRYYETEDPATMPQIFTKETMQASRWAIKEDLSQPSSPVIIRLYQVTRRSSFPTCLGT